MEVRKRDIGERLIDFSAEVIRMVDKIPNCTIRGKISDQLIRSVMSVGANYEEARGADSKADFSYKLQIALKEMRETRYWLCLIAKLQLGTADKMTCLIDEATQLRAILGKSVATSRGVARALSAGNPIKS